MIAVWCEDMLEEMARERERERERENGDLQVTVAARSKFGRGQPREQPGVA